MARPQVTRDDWTAAALEALGDGGVSAVRVDVLSRRLGVTRGSFYWHFENREALVVAALEKWERVCTTETIEQLDSIADPEQRLRILLTQALDVEALSRLEPAIVAHATDPVVGPVLRRVTQRRVDYLTSAYAELGHSPAAARRQALVAYAAYTGWLQLRSAAGAELAELADTGRRGAAARRHLADELVHGPSPATG